VKPFENLSSEVAHVCIWISLLFSSGCTSEFFVDKGQLEIFEGVEFHMRAPYLFEKKAFKLQGENLSVRQLRVISEAMPSISQFTNERLGNRPHHHFEVTEDARIRNIRQMQKLDAQTFLAVKTLQNWQVSEDKIQFTTDYFHTNKAGHFVTFRDNYLFLKINNQWTFKEHPQPAPEGVLACKKSAEGWMVCQEVTVKPAVTP